MAMQLLERGNHVVAAARNPGKATGLQDLSTKFGSALTLVTLDVSDAGSIEVQLPSSNQTSPSDTNIFSPRWRGLSCPLTC